MKKGLSSKLTILLVFTVISVANVFGQNQSYSFKVDSISIATERSQIFSNFGDFIVHGIDENGNSVSRVAHFGSFGVIAGPNCIPCRKGSVFNSQQSGSFSWLTNGNTQNPPQEWATFTGQITYSSWILPIQSPRNKIFVKHIPVRFQGSLTIVKSTGTSTISYTDPEVDLNGFAQSEFKQMLYDPKLFEWMSFQISASETP